MKAVFREDAYWRRYSQEEARELFLPVVRPLILPREQAGYLKWGPTDGRVFARNDWIRVAFDAMPCGDADWFDNITGRTDVHQHDPVSGHWYPLRPLWQAVVEDEVDEVILMHSPYTALHGATATIPLPLATNPVRNEPFGFFEGGVVFPRKGNWLLVGTTEEVSVLAGEPAFMEKVIDYAGGVDFLKQIFDETWEGLKRDRSPGMHNFAYCTYLAAGWEAPDYIRRDVTPLPGR